MEIANLGQSFVGFVKQCQLVPRMPFQRNVSEQPVKKHVLAIYLVSLQEPRVLVSLASVLLIFERVPSL